MIFDEYFGKKGLIFDRNIISFVLYPFFTASEIFAASEIRPLKITELDFKLLRDLENE
jgi:hypothetical protein